MLLSTELLPHIFHRFHHIASSTRTHARDANIDVLIFFFFSDTATPEIYTLSLHDALPIFLGGERSIELGRELFRLPGDIAMERQGLRHTPSVMRHDSGRGVDGKCRDLRRLRAGDLLDIHAAGGGD